MIQMAVRIDHSGEKPVLRLSVSRDGDGGVASFVCGAINASAVRALVAGAAEAVTNFLTADLEKQNGQ